MRYFGIVVALAMVAGGAFGDLLVNGDFEGGVANWTKDPSSGNPIELNSGIWGPGTSPNGGNYASLQTGGNQHRDWVGYQTVVVPGGTPAVQFKGYYAGGEAGTWSGTHGVWLYDGAWAGIGGTVLGFDSRFLPQGTPLGWTAFDFSVDAPVGGFAGGQVTVAWGWQNTSGGWSDGTATHVDGLELTAIPEPGTILLGLAGLALLRRRR